MTSATDGRVIPHDTVPGKGRLRVQGAWAKATVLGLLCASIAASGLAPDLRGESGPAIRPAAGPDVVDEAVKALLAQAEPEPAWGLAVAANRPLVLASEPSMMPVYAVGSANTDAPGISAQDGGAPLAVADKQDAANPWLTDSPMETDQVGDQDPDHEKPLVPFPVREFRGAQRIRAADGLARLDRRETGGPETALALCASEDDEAPGSGSLSSREDGGFGPAPEAGAGGIEAEARVDEPVWLADAGQAGRLRQKTAASPGEDKLVESIKVSSERVRHVTVSKDGMATIDLKKPADRVEIRDPAIADLTRPTPQRILVVGKGFGTTQLVLWSGDEQQVVNIFVEMDVSKLHEAIRSEFPTAEVQARSVNGTIVLRGTVPDAVTSEQIMELAGLIQGGEVKNQLRVVGVQQTMLRVVVAEVNREAMRQLGFNWAIGGSDWSRDFFLANNVSQLNPTIFGSSGLNNLVLPNNLGGQMTYNVAANANGATTNVTFGFPRAEFQVFMNALRENSLARTLAEPNLVAVSGQTAKFLAGGEVPIPVAQAGAAAGGITVEYREFGVRLGFTPTVMSGQIIRIHVMSEVSEAVPTQQLAGGFPVFTFNTRRVESTIECGNGQTFAIAGLLSEEVRAVASKIPGLGDIPVLGSLFSSTNYERSNTELVVLVTPELVEPLDPQQVPPVPGSLMTDPNDFELFAMQRLEGSPLVVEEPEGVPREHVPVNTRPLETTNLATSQLALRGPWGLADLTDAD